MSETIKVLCYKSKTLANGEHPLMLCVYKDRKRKYQSLGISVNAKYWNFKDNCLKEDCPNYELLQLIIDTELGKIKMKALEKRLEGKVFTATTLLETTEKPPVKTVGEYYLQYIESLKAENIMDNRIVSSILQSATLTFNQSESMHQYWSVRKEQSSRSNGST